MENEWIDGPGDAVGETTGLGLNSSFTDKVSADGDFDFEFRRITVLH